MKKTYQINIFKRQKLDIFLCSITYIITKHITFHINVNGFIQKFNFILIKIKQNKRDLIRTKNIKYKLQKKKNTLTKTFVLKKYRLSEPGPLCFSSSFNVADQQSITTTSIHKPGQRVSIWNWKHYDTWFSVWNICFQMKKYKREVKYDIRILWQILKNHMWKKKTFQGGRVLENNVSEIFFSATVRVEWTSVFRLW